MGLVLIAPSLLIFLEGMLLMETMTVFAVTLLASPFIKIILSLILFRKGLNLLYVKRTKKWGVFVHILFGILTIVPFFVGDPSMIILIILTLGPLPFIPYFIAGSLFILAGIMGWRWKR